MKALKRSEQHWKVRKTSSCLVPSHTAGANADQLVIGGHWENLIVRKVKDGSKDARADENAGTKSALTVGSSL